MTMVRYSDLAGKRVLVTGGGSGIGAATVAAFAEQGARVGFVDIDAAAGQATAGRLTAEAAHAVRFRRSDVTDLDAFCSDLKALMGELGGADILVNNAANDDRHALETVTPAYWRERMAVNLDHHFFAGQTVIPAMRAAGGGAIVNLGSISWQLKLRDLVAYQTAKAAIEGLTRSLARELGRDAIRVNAVLPGAVDTPRQKRWVDDAASAQLLADQCLAFRIQPPDIAAMVLFLASDAARACTAQTFVVDGGLI